MNVDERMAYRQTAHWAGLRAACIAAALGRCEVCGAAASHAHHLNPGDYGHEELVDYCLVAMCLSCHQRAHPGWAERESRVISRDWSREVTR